LRKGERGQKKGESCGEKDLFHGRVADRARIESIAQETLKQDCQGRRGERTPL
jgi:hypothetical protein